MGILRCFCMDELGIKMVDDSTSMSDGANLMKIYKIENRSCGNCVKFAVITKYPDNPVMIMKVTFLILLLALMGVSCSRKSTESAEAQNPVAIGVGRVLRPSTGSPAMAYPKATAFKMSGDYADNVAIGMDGNGQITYYPAPTDISEGSKPIEIGGGWWLNRQGIGADAVFTRYTFDEYSKLKAVPSLEELKAAVIPGAKVTMMEQLPFNIGEAPSHLSEIKEYLEKKSPKVLAPASK